MAARKPSMAQPRSRSGKRSPAAATQPRSPVTPPPRRRALSRMLASLTGPTGRQFAALALIAWGLVTIATLAGWNSGVLIGAWARALVFLFGWGAYPTAGLIGALGALWLRHLVHQPTAWRWRPFIGLELALFSLLALTHAVVYRYGWSVVSSGRGGGLVGWGLCVALATYVGPLIAGVIYALLAAVGVLWVFDWTTADVKRVMQGAGAALTTAIEQRRRAEPPTSADVTRLGQGVLASPVAPRPTAEREGLVARLRGAKLLGGADETDAAPQEAGDAGSAGVAERRSGARPADVSPTAAGAEAAPPAAEVRTGASAAAHDTARESKGEARARPATSRVAETLPGPGSAAQPARPDGKPSAAAGPVSSPKPAPLPPMSLLREGRSVGMSDDEIRAKSRIIEQTLAQFGVPAEVVEVRRGPTVTQFGVAPGYITREGAEGEQQRKVRVSQIAALKDDLALALAARSLRIEAPVPGRAVVGIEVPNDEVSLVTLRSVMESETFQRKAKPLTFAVGLDVAGEPVVADLGSMPHLLVAGTTGSGKSVFMKALAASLIMRNTPEQLRLVAIDPKMVELSRFNGLPHLYGRAETDLERALRVLRWVVYEMDARYKLFAGYAARNLDDYNARIARLNENAEQPMPPLPRIVVLIDELADLMLSAGEETERTLTRLAQMARATGIHLVVATQRPSTDVVTGLIKANFPARISFATASQVDSRVILDTPGAEALLGQGDMLFLAPDASAPKRVQGCFISDEELEALIRYWQQVAGATPAVPPWDTLIAERGLDPLESKEDTDEDEALIEQAIALARQMGSISTSAIQRRLRISYNRAALIMEELEERGIVGPQESAGRPRRVILGGEED